MASHPRPDFQELIAMVARELAARDLPFMVIGGQAVLVHGRPRLTQDIDITLGVGPDALDEVLAIARAAGLDPVPEDPASFVRRTFVLPAVQPSTGIRVDFIFSTTPYEAEAIRRASRVEIRGVSVPFATPEDLILHKLFAGRPRDLEDAESVVHRKRDEIDWEYLQRWAQEFAAVPGRETMPRRVEALFAKGMLPDLGDYGSLPSP
jgi:predicted nucleotidyltransferase